MSTPAAVAMPLSNRRLAATATALPPGVAPAGARGVLLDAALHLFAERGYGGTSVRDIAARAGVQPATLYAHYPSKEHVLAEVCRFGHEVHQKVVRDALLESGADPREQVAAYVRAHVLFHARYSMLAVVCNSEMHMLSPELGAATFDVRRRNVEMLMTLIERGVAQGLFDVPHVWLAAAMIGGPGLRVANWFNPDFELSAEAVADIYVQYAWRILGQVTPVEQKKKPPRKAGAASRRS